MKTLVKLMFAIVIIAAFLIVVSFFLPSKVLVSQSLRVEVSVEQVFNKVNNLRNWRKWSPWLAPDSIVEIDYDSFQEGEGAGFCWQNGTEKFWDGCVTIVESNTNKSLTIFLDFIDEGKGTGKETWLFEKVEKDLEDVTSQDEVYLICTREIKVDYPPVIGKYMGLFLKDKLQSDLKLALAMLKSHAEQENNQPEPEIKVVDYIGQRVLSIYDSCHIDDIGDKLNELYVELNIFMGLNSLEYGGQPMTIYHSWRPEDNFTIIEAAIPVLHDSIETSGRIHLSKLSSGKVATATHYGLFSDSDIKHRAIEKWMKKNGKTLNGPPWEVYVTDPSIEKDTARWETRVFYPLRSN